MPRAGAGLAQTFRAYQKDLISEERDPAEAAEAAEAAKREADAAGAVQAAVVQVAAVAEEHLRVDAWGLVAVEAEGVGEADGDAGGGVGDAGIGEQLDDALLPRAVEG